MHQTINELVNGFDFMNKTQSDSIALLKFCKLDEVAEHTQKVALTAARLADRFDADRGKALKAGFLHDMGNIIPAEEMVRVATEAGIEVLPAEKEYPPLLHQKLAKLVAVDYFKVNDSEILHAVECHTTLRGNPEKLDMVLFIADKLEWDEQHKQRFIVSVTDGLNRSLEEGVFSFVNYAYHSKVKVMHPWLVEAYNHLNHLIK